MLGATSAAWEIAASRPRPTLARSGEEAAAALFESLGYRVAARNVRLGRREIDLVLRKGRDLVFCEVKTRRGAALGHPEEAVDERKQARLVRAAEAYLSRHPPAGDVRFDVVSVRERTPGDLVVLHIPGAFRPW